MWQKTRSILTYMYDNYFGDYEYFYLAGDDTHVIVENLRRYLYTVEQTHDVATEPLFMGALTYRKRKKDFPYNDGGAGYLLNRVALKRLVLEVFPNCEAEKQTAAEDILVAQCLREMKIYPLHTIDAQGRQRFIGRPTEFMGSFDGMEGFAKPFYAAWGRKYGWRTGADIVSESSVAFHLFRTDDLMMKRHHAIIYDSCPVGTVLDIAVQKGRDAFRVASASSIRADSTLLSPNPDRVFWCGYNSLFGDSDFNIAKVLCPGVPAKGFQYTMDFGPTIFC
jgi:hypothetical protein